MMNTPPVPGSTQFVELIRRYEGKKAVYFDNSESYFLTWPNSAKGVLKVAVSLAKTLSQRPSVVTAIP